MYFQAHDIAPVWEKHENSNHKHVISSSMILDWESWPNPRWRKLIMLGSKFSYNLRLSLRKLSPDYSHPIFLNPLLRAQRPDLGHQSCWDPGGLAGRWRQAVQTPSHGQLLLEDLPALKTTGHRESCSKPEFTIELNLTQYVWKGSQALI